MNKNRKIFAFFLSAFVIISAMITPAFSQEGVTRSVAIANIDTQVKFDKSIVQPGETFVLQLQVNSVAIGEEDENENGIKSLNISFDIPSSVEVKKMPVNSAFTITQTGQTITITGNTDIRVAKLFLMDFEFAYKEGKYPTDASLRVFEPDVKVSATNANINQPISGKVELEIRDQQTPILSVEKEDKSAHVIHTATITLTPEPHIGGLDHNSASVRLDLPDDIILYSAMYNGTNYPVQTDSNGKYIEVSVGSLLTSGVKQVIVLNYKYDFVDAPDERLIDVTYSGTRDGIGTQVTETGVVKDLVYPIGSGESTDAKEFFTKEGSSTVIRESGQKVIYEVELRPQSDLKDVYLIDNPLANESEYFDALQFSKISWSAKTSVNPSLTDLVKTKVSYQTNKDSSWKTATSQYTSSGQVLVADLGLDSDEYITKLKYDFNYNGTSTIPLEAGKVVITMEADTLAGITNRTTGLDDGLTNTLSIYGEQKDVGASTYTKISEEDDNNVHTFTTTYIDRGAGIGLSNPGLANDWESMFSPRNPAIGETFTYQVNMNNVDGTGDLLSAVGYIIVPANIDFKKVELVNSNNAPNATFETRTLSNGSTLVVVHYNKDLSQSWYGNQYAVKITAVGTGGTSATFSAYFASENPNQKYVHATHDNYIDTVGSYKQDNYGVRHQTITFLEHVDLDVSKEVSINGTDYTKNIMLTQADWDSLTDQEVYYKISITNNSSSKFTQLRVIDMLPELSDSLVMTDNPKNSSLVTDFVSIDYSTSSTATVDYAFSENATYDNNVKDLSDFALDNNTWTTFNGLASDSSYTDANAIRIDINNLEQNESIEFIVKVKVPQPESKVKVAWNSIGYGGKLDTGTYIIPGEPYKSGIYSSTYSADAEISGVAWEDLNGNDMKDADEPLFTNKEVKLLAKNGDIVAETVTDSNGLYQFTGLFPGKYTVVMNYMGPQYYLSTPNIGGDDVNSDFVDWDNAGVQVEADVALAEGEVRQNVDAGFYRTLNVGDLVWNDENMNGQYDSGEKGISNYELTLVRLDDSGNATSQAYTTKTNDQGIYTFYKVKPGKYKITTQPKEGFVVSQLGTSPDGNIFTLNSTDSVVESGVLQFTSGVSDMDCDLGMYQANQTISGSIFYDMNYDSMYNGESVDQAFTNNVDENDVQILKVELLDNNNDVIDETGVASDGSFIFTDVDPGDYYVQISIADEYSEYLKCAPKFVATTRGIVMNDVSVFNDDTIITDKITVVANSNVSDQNLGLQPYYDLTIIKEDSEDQTRLDGAEFELSLDKITVGENQKSNNDGEIIYEKIKAGDYELQEITAPEGYELSDTIYSISLNDTKTFAWEYTVTNEKTSEGTDPTTPVDPENPDTPDTPDTPDNPDDKDTPKPPVDTTDDLKPSASSSKANSTNVATGDTTNLTMLYALLVSSLLGFVVIAKRRNEQN